MTESAAAEEIRLIDCNETDYAATILEILNEAIVNSTALYDYAPRPFEAMAAWFATKRANGFPVVGAVDSTGKLLGFASWGTFRAFPAYQYTVEHSVYVHHGQRGRGLGRLLLGELIRRAQEADVHVLIGCIDSTNAASIGLHLQLGFAHAGTFRQVGYKFGRWLDADFYQLTLEGPAEPRER